MFKVRGDPYNREWGISEPGNPGIVESRNHKLNNLLIINAFHDKCTPLAAGYLVVNQDIKTPDKNI